MWNFPNEQETKRKSFILSCKQDCLSESMPAGHEAMEMFRGWKPVYRLPRAICPKTQCKNSFLNPLNSISSQNPKNSNEKVILLSLLIDCDFGGFFPKPIKIGHSKNKVNLFKGKNLDGWLQLLMQNRGRDI